MGSHSIRANALATQAPSRTSALPQTTPTMIIQQPKGVTGHRSRQAPFIRLNHNTSKVAHMEVWKAKNARLMILSHARLPIPTLPHFEKHTRPHFHLFWPISACPRPPTSLLGTIANPCTRVRYRIRPPMQRALAPTGWVVARVRRGVAFQVPNRGILLWAYPYIRAGRRSCQQLL